MNEMCSSVSWLIFSFFMTYIFVETVTYSSLYCYCNGELILKKVKAFKWRWGLIPAVVSVAG